MTRPLKMAIAGLGLIGKSHESIIRNQVEGMELTYVVDPTKPVGKYCAEQGILYFPTLEALFSKHKPDGIIIATPNQVHVENGLVCVEAGCPMLVEKPLAVSTDNAQILVDRAKDANIPLLVGHHRRHNPIIQSAKSVINSGQLGDIMNVSVMFWMSKPDQYFEHEWRRKKGAGPMMVNAIHDMDLIRYLCGEVESLQAIASNDYRGFENENSGVVLLKFRSGALGTVNISDAVASPWSWEMTSGENQAFDKTSQSSYKIGGTLGSLSLPDLTLWSHGKNGHWKTPITQKTIEVQNCDPLVQQMLHFERVIRGNETPLVSGQEGLNTLRVLEAIQESIQTGITISI